MNRFELALGRRRVPPEPAPRKPTFRQAPQRIYEYFMGVDIGPKGGTAFCIVHANEVLDIFLDVVEEFPETQVWEAGVSVLAIRIAEQHQKWDGYPLKMIMTDQCYGEQLRLEVERRIPGVPVVVRHTTKQLKEEMETHVDSLKRLGRVRAWPGPSRSEHVRDAFVRAVWMIDHMDHRGRT